MSKIDGKLYSYQIAERIKKIRLQKNISQTDLARKSGISQGMICHFEMAKAEMTVDAAIRIAVALGCSLDYLLNNEQLASGPDEVMIQGFHKLDIHTQKIVRNFIVQGAKEVACLSET